MKSLQQQLSILLGMSVIAVFFIFWWLSITTIHKVTDDYVLTRLSHDSDTLLSNIHFTNGNWSFHQENIDPIYVDQYSGHYYIIQVENRVFKSPSLSGYPLFLKPTNEATTVYETLGPEIEIVRDNHKHIQRSKLLVLTTKKIVNNADVTLYVAEDHSPIQASLVRFDWIYGVLALMTLLILYFLQKWILKRTFSQLVPLEKRLKELEISHQFSVSDIDYPKEVASLIDALEVAVNQATNQLKHSRQSNANLSHGLKTPLNIAFQLIEQMQQNQQPEKFAELQQQVQQQLTKINQLIERELKKARIASQSPMMKAFDYAEDLDELTSSLQLLHAEKQIKMNINLEILPQFIIEKEDGYELFGNLLDNAFKWGHEQIVFSTSASSIVIEDDGKGVNNEQLHSIQNRGYRADEVTPGYGIGLSIVSDLVKAYGGQIQYSRSRLGGLKVTLSF